MHQIYIILAWAPSAVQVTKSYSRRLPALERFYKQRSPLYIYLSISVITVCLSVCLSHHNSGTPGPICLKFLFGNPGDPREFH